MKKLRRYKAGICVFLSFCVVFVSLGCKNGAVKTQQKPEQVQKSNNIILLPFIEKDKKGFINQDGTVVVEPQYDWADISKDGMASFETEGKWGFVNLDGVIVIEPSFDYVEDFENGFASFGVGNGCFPLSSQPEDTCEYGIIDKQGRVVIEPKYKDIRRYSDELFIVVDSNGYGLIDIDKDIVVETIYEYIGPMTNGYAKYKADDKYGYLSEQGNVAISAQFDEAEDFNGDVAVIAEKSSSIVGLQGLVDRKGNVVLKPDFRIIGNYSDGLATFGTNPGWNNEDRTSIPRYNWKFGFLNAGGEVSIEQEYSIAESFSNGFAPVAFGNSCDCMFGDLSRDCKWSYINEAGELIVEPQFAYVGHFSEGFAVAGVIVDDQDEASIKYGYIDTLGNFAIPAQYSIAESFSDGRAMVAFGDYCPERVMTYDCQWGLIDTDGNFVVEPKYSEMKYLSDGIYRTIGPFGYANREGKILWMSSQ